MGSTLNGSNRGQVSQVNNNELSEETVSPERENYVPNDNFIYIIHKGVELKILGSYTGVDLASVVALTPRSCA